MDNSTEHTLKMPASVAAAIVGVMGKIKKLEKDNKNTYENYDFTSIDDFMEFMNPILAEEGLIILQSESAKPELVEKAGKNGNVLMLWCEYDFMLVSEEGDMYGPLRRSVMVQATGAQAFGSAQSYALKQLERSLFQIPTGDKDDPDNNATKQIAEPPTIDAQKIAKSLNTRINNTKTEKDVDVLLKEYNDDFMAVKTASQTAYDFLMEAIKKRKDTLNDFVNTEAADKEMDEQYNNTVSK